MTSPLPSDPFVSQFIDNLCGQFPNRWWPKFLFHYSDINNIVRILESGYLYSRNRAKDNNLLVTDSASQEIIDKTEKQWLNYARLYFRPKTPPLYHVEGFRSKKEINNSHYKSHCPLPVYLLFDSKTVLSIPNIGFSDINLGSPKHVFFNDLKNLQNLNFHKIYHLGPILTEDDEEKKDIIRHRCAEVIIKDGLPLEKILRFIICRSSAERETLITLLSYNSYKKYERFIRVHPDCFHLKHQHIRSVNLLANQIGVEYFDDSRDFHYCFAIEVGGLKKELMRDRPRPQFRIGKSLREYTFSIKLDNNLAYKNKYYEYDLPF